MYCNVTVLVPYFFFPGSWFVYMTDFNFREYITLVSRLMRGADCCTIGTFHNPFEAQRPVNTGGLVNVICTASSLQMIIFFLSRIDIILLSACTNSDSKFWAIGILWAMVAFVGKKSTRLLSCVPFVAVTISTGRQ